MAVGVGGGGGDDGSDGDAVNVDLTTAAGEWLVQRRARGYRSAADGYLIAGFIRFVTTRDVSVITAADVLAYAQLPSGTSLCCIRPGCGSYPVSSGNNCYELGCERSA